jgi:hypothetical protein
MIAGLVLMPVVDRSSVVAMVILLGLGRVPR